MLLLQLLGKNYKYFFLTPFLFVHLYFPQTLIVKMRSLGNI